MSAPPWMRTAVRVGKLFCCGGYSLVTRTLRHAGLTLTAQLGATQAEVMHRAGADPAATDQRHPVEVSAMVLRPLPGTWFTVTRNTRSCPSSL